MNASVQGSETGETTVSSKFIKVVDLDTITQAKEKIIDGLFSDLPFSEQPKPNDLEFGKIYFYDLLVLNFYFFFLWLFKSSVNNLKMFF